VQTIGEMLPCLTMTDRKFLEQRVTSAVFRTLCFVHCFTIYFRYFGRAKELPGVRELFQSRKKEEEEENQVTAFYKKFTNQGPVYFGDLDETDGRILSYEKKAEDEGKFPATGLHDVCN
jgi:hypothetical protein